MTDRPTTLSVKELTTPTVKNNSFTLDVVGQYTLTETFCGSVIDSTPSECFQNRTLKIYCFNFFLAPNARYNLLPSLTFLHRCYYSRWSMHWILPSVYTYCSLINRLSWLFKAVGKMRNCGMRNAEGKMRNGMCGKLQRNCG